MMFALSFAFACGKEDENDDDKQNQTVEYTVTFVVDGEKTEVKVKDGEKVAKPADPVKEGYTFVGWYVGEEAYDFDAVTADVTVTAKFEEVKPEVKEYTVKFVVDGEASEVKVAEGEKASKPADPVKEGYVFLGWYVGDEAYDFEKAVTADVELVAKFEAAAVETKYDFVVGAFEGTEVEVEGDKYVVGETAFATVIEALEKAEEGAVIYVTAGEYAITELIKVEKSVTLVGPNADKAANEERAPEALFTSDNYNTGSFMPAAANITFNGLGFKGVGNQGYPIQAGAELENFTIKSCYFENVNTVFCSFDTTALKGTLTITETVNKDSLQFLAWIGTNDAAELVKFEYTNNVVYGAVAEHYATKGMISFRTAETNAEVVIEGNDFDLEGYVLTSNPIYVAGGKLVVKNNKFNGVAESNLFFEGTVAAEMEGNEFIVPRPVDPTDFTLTINGVEYADGATIELVELTEYQIVFKYEPADKLVNEGVDISSSMDDIVSVDSETLLLTTHSVGMSMLEVAGLYCEAFKTYVVKVVEKHFVPETITIDDKYTTVEVDDILKLKAAVLPERASQEVKWESADEAIAVVDPVTGVVTGKQIGKVKIKAISTEVEEVVGEIEIEVIEAVPADKSVVYVGAEYSERGTVVTIDGKEYIVGKNATDNLTDANRLVDEGGVVKVQAGTYADDSTIVKGAKFVALGDVEITGTILLANGLSGLEFDGFTFSGRGAVLSAKGTGENGLDDTQLYENVTVKNCKFLEVGAGDDASFHIYGLAKNFVFENNEFTFATYRGIRFENVIENLQVINNKLYSNGTLFDAVRAMDVAKGDVVFKGNEFVKSAQTMIYIEKLAGTANITIESNSFTNCQCAIIDIRSYKGVIEEANIRINIRFNQFLDSTVEWGCIRLRPGGLDAEKYFANINFNKFKGVGLTDDPNHATYCTWYIQNATATLADGTNVKADFLCVNADYNWSDFGKPKAAWINDIGTSWARWYVTESLIDEVIAKGEVPANPGEDDVEVSEYEVTFVVEGQENVVVKVAAGAKVEKPADPVKEGYKFVGWFAGDEAYDFEAAVNAALELTAKFEEESGEQPGDDEEAKAIVDAFAEEMVALFGKYNEEAKAADSKAKDTTKENFQGSTHPQVKFVFSDADNLAQYKWFLEFALSEYKLNLEKGNVTATEYYTEPVEMLEKMIAGDTSAINGSYANGRSCFRQFIHEVINANTPENAGNSAYDPYVFDYDSDAEALARFVAAYKAANGVQETLADIIAKAEAGSKVVVPAGTYEVELVIDKAITIEAEGEVVLTQPVKVNASNVKFVGVTFNTKAGVQADVAVENVVFDACKFAGTLAIDATKGTIFFAAEAKDIVFTGCEFACNDARVVRFGATVTNLTIEGCTFNNEAGVWDTVLGDKIVQGQVNVVNNVFDFCNQAHVKFNNMGAEAKYNISDNVFDGAVCTSIDIRTISGDATNANIVIDVIGNTFSGENDWTVIRFRAAGLAEGQIVANVNYNTFKDVVWYKWNDQGTEYVLDEQGNKIPVEVTRYVQQAGTAVSFNYINADYNYCDKGVYKEGWVENCASAEGWFDSEEALADAYAKTKAQVVTVAEALVIGAPLAQNAVAEGVYQVTGVIANVTNTQYGNVYISDDNFKTEILIYGINGYSDLEYKPVKGDTITVVGQISNFAGAAQFKSVELVSYEKGVLEVTVDPAGEVKTIAEALAKVNYAGKVIVKAGTYEEAIKIEKAVTIEAEGEVVLTNQIEIAANDVIFKGIKFTAGTPIISSVAIENITFDSCVVEAAALGSADAMFQFNGYVTNFVAKDCSFSMKTNRGIRFEVGGKDVEVVNCEFFGNGTVFDHILFYNAATGNITVAGCSFKDSNQSFVKVDKLNGLEIKINITDNVFDGATSTSIDIRTHVGADAAEAKVEYNFTGNVVSGANGWTAFRLRAAGLTEGNVKANINYNIFKETANRYVNQAPSPVAFNYINADYNYSAAGAYQEGWVENCASAEGWFESEEALVAAYAATKQGTATVVLAEQGYENAQSVAEVKFGEVTLALSKGAGTNEPKYYTSGNALRTYTNNEMTFSIAAGLKIVSIKVKGVSNKSLNAECVVTNGALVIDSNDATVATITPVDGAAPIVILNPGKAQVHFVSIEVVYAAA